MYSREYYPLAIITKIQDLMLLSLGLLPTECPQQHPDWRFLLGVVFLKHYRNFIVICPYFYKGL